MIWIVTAVLVVLAGSGWAAEQILSGPDRDVVEDQQYVLAEAVPGVVEQSLQLNTAAAWSMTDAYISRISGIVTEVFHSDGAEAAAGDVLFTVDLQPVVVAEGTVPSFRTLSEGAEGEDVAQLQRLLSKTGYFDGEDDGDFDYQFRSAVREWQRDLGVKATGSVDAGAILFLPELPAHLALTEEVKVGASLSGDSKVVGLLPAGPQFTIELPEGQARIVETGMAVTIQASDSSWRAVITEIQLNENEIYTAELYGVEGDSICGDECDQIPLDESILLPSTIYIVPAVEGVTVPAAAITTGADGQTIVVTEDGRVVAVEVLAGAEGTVVLDGIEVGQRVRVPGGDA